MGLNNGIHWVTYLHLDNMNFVLDSKKVVQYFSTSKNDITEFVCIMNACKQLFQSSFQNSHVEFSQRQFNVVGHSCFSKGNPILCCSHLFDDVSS